ncbi:hypothetical protein GCM10009857_24770 [Agromyces soli]
MTVELLGDRWSLIVLRDIVFGGHRHFRELLANSLEGIASNILSSRLTKLVEAGLLTRNEDPSHRQKIDYRLTEAAIELIPVLAQLGKWGNRWLPTSPELAIRAQILADGGPRLWDRFMDELRDVHLHGKPSAADSVMTELSQASARAALSPAAGASLRVGLGVLEELVDAEAEDTTELEGELEGRRVLALLDRDEGLPGHADPARELGLRQAGALTDGPDAIGHPGGLHHQASPRR